MEIRPLRADEVNCRLSQCIDGKAQFLLYVDSRACRKILDETFGVFGWQDRYSEVKGALSAAGKCVWYTGSASMHRVQHCEKREPPTAQA